jgi:hypothetical protein
MAGHTFLGQSVRGKTAIQVNGIAKIVLTKKILMESLSGSSVKRLFHIEVDRQE